MKIPEIMQEIKERYSHEFMNAITTPDKKGTGFVCPFCGSGKGKNGTGMKPGTKNPNFFKCWNCGFEGDLFDIIKGLYHCTDATDMIRKAEDILHRQFLDNKNNMQYSNAMQHPAERRDKNMVQNSDKRQEADKNTIQNNEDLRKKTKEIRAYMKVCMEALSQSKKGIDYLERRGISFDTAVKNHIGYTDNYKDGMNTAAVIIPTGPDSYTARSIDTNESSRKIRKRNAGGRQGIFNVAALKEPTTTIFLVEGEFDALSVLETGYPAIATGGGTSERELIAVIKESANRPEAFVILPDNDRKEDGTPDEAKGYAKGVRLKDGLDAAGVKSYLIDTRMWGPHIKDSNDYLVSDKAGFKKMLASIAEPIKAAALRRLGRTSDYMQEFVNNLAGKLPPVPTGFKNLDELLDGGLYPGLIVVGALPSLGKTTFTLNVANNLAHAGQDVIFVSLEMSRFELISKSISRRTYEFCKHNKKPLRMAKSNLGITDFDRWKRYSQEELNMIQGCMEDYQSGAAQNLFIIEGSGNVGTATIREAVRKHIAITGKRPVVIVDYIQILTPEDPHMTDKQAVDRNVVELKRISRDFNVVMIGISSFNRESYYAPASLSALKESGSLEYGSDQIFLMELSGMSYQEGEKEKDRAERIRQLVKTADASGRAGGEIRIELKIMKNRSGAKGSCELGYYPMFNCYTD